MTHTAGPLSLPGQGAAPDRGPAGTRALPPGGAPGFAPGDSCRLWARIRPCAANPAAPRGVPSLSGRRPAAEADTVAAGAASLLVASPGGAEVGGAPC